MEKFVFVVARGYQRSLIVTPFNREHMHSYDTTYSRFDGTPTSDTETDGHTDIWTDEQTHRAMTYTAPA